ncbi:MAG: hypothetical protein GMKNLPBB_00082 [Myxococcota bacterium]|nr:hypothetical protein [Myxococcota bacterium]
MSLFQTIRRISNVFFGLAQSVQAPPAQRPAAGKRLVRECLRKFPARLESASTPTEAKKIFRNHPECDYLPVFDGDQFLGLLPRQVNTQSVPWNQGLDEQSVAIPGRVASLSLLKNSPLELTDTIDMAIGRMKAEGIKALPVRDRGEIAGMVDWLSLLRSSDADPFDR